MAVDDRVSTKPKKSACPDWKPKSIAAVAPSGTGFQLSLLGAAGILAAVQEGIELNLLGLTFGIDVITPALKLPMIGRVGALPVLGIALLVAALALVARRLAR